MAEEITKIIKIEASGSEQTVKGLKKEIDSLRDALLNTEKGTDEYKKVLEQLIGDQKKLADTMAAGKNEVSAATGSYNALKNEMSALKKVWAEVTDEASRSEIGKRIDEINTELKEMDSSIGNFQRNVGNYASGFKNARQELAALKTQMDNLEVGTEEYNAAFLRAAEITHTMSERQEMLKYSAADLGTQLSNVASIGSSLVAGFNSVNAIIALTGEKSEDLQKVMVKLQAGIALVQGLQGLEGMTKRMTGLVEGLTTMIFKTNETTAAVNTETVAVQANATAQEANTVATNAATVATNGFKKALVATGIGAIVVLIGSLIANWDSLKETIGLSNEKLEKFGQILDQVKVVIAGVGNVLLNLLITPIKNAITYVETLGNVIKDVFTFNFSKIGEDIKTGFNKIVEQVKDGYDIVGNYQEAANKKSDQLREKRLEKAAKASAAELNELIKDNEAKYGSDWKYTEEGKKLYDQYFEKKLAGYKKDSKEYREAMREKWSYDREYQKHLDDASKTQSKQAKENTKQQLTDEEKKTQKELEDIDKIQKRAEDAAKTELQLLKEKYEEEKALFEKHQKDITALTAEYEAKKAKIEADAAAKKEADKQKAIDEYTKRTLALSDRALRSASDTNTQEVTEIRLEYSLEESKRSGTLSFSDIIEETNKIYEANKKHLEAQAAEYKKLMEDNDLDVKARETAARDYTNTMMELRNLETKNMIDNNNQQRDIIQAQIKMYSDLAVAIGNIFGSIADMLEDDIKQKVKNEEITQEEGEKQFEAVKAFQIAQATINTISGAIAAYMSCQTLPWPTNAIIGAIQAAAVTAAGVAQIAKIKNTQLGSSSSISANAAGGAVQTAPEEYQPQMYQNPTGESEIVNLANSIKDQKVYVVESDISEAQRKSKVRVTESTW